jgi:hypothetical protein
VRERQSCGDPMQTYTHKDIGEEISAISGYFTYLEESRLNVRGRDLLYAVGIGIVDNSCCGVGGCLFIEVPGYIVAWKNEVDKEGRWISRVDPVASEEEKNRIRKSLLEFYPWAQVTFG